MVRMAAQISRSRAMISAFAQGETKTLTCFPCLIASVQLHTVLLSNDINVDQMIMYQARRSNGQGKQVDICRSVDPLPQQTEPRRWVRKYLGRNSGDPFFQVSP